MFSERDQKTLLSRAPLAKTNKILAKVVAEASAMVLGQVVGQALV